MHPSPGTPVSLRELVAGNLRRLRLAAGREPEELVPTARANGLDWTVAWLTSVERGTRALTAEQLLALPVVLSAALGHRVSLADLLVGEAPVILGPAGDRPAPNVPPAYLLDVVTGHPIRRTFTPIPRPTESAEARASARAAQRMRDIREAGLGDVDIRALARAEAGAGPAEAKLARKLAVPPIAVAAAAASLWGRSLAEEQASLVAGGMSNAAAGRQVNSAVEVRLRDAALAMMDARLAARATDQRPDDAGAWDLDPKG